MGEDLNKANKNFQEMLEKIKTEKEIDKGAEAMLYIFYLAGWRDGSGEVQVVA